MSRRKYLMTLALVGGVSLVFGMMLASGPLRPVSATSAPSVWSPAIAAPSNTVLQATPGGAPLTFADVAETANKAVVSIANVEFKTVRNPHGQGGPFGGDPFEFFFGPRRNQDPQDDEEGEDPWGGDQQRLESGGSGFIISEDGYILTNNHVVENASKLEVTLEGGKKYEAKVVGTDPMIDLALIKI